MRITCKSMVLILAVLFVSCLSSCSWQHSRAGHRPMATAKVWAANEVDSGYVEVLDNQFKSTLHREMPQFNWRSASILACLSPEQPWIFSGAAEIDPEKITREDDPSSYKRYLGFRFTAVVGSTQGRQNSDGVWVIDHQIGILGIGFAAGWQSGTESLRILEELNQCTRDLNLSDHPMVRGKFSELHHGSKGMYGFNMQPLVSLTGSYRYESISSDWVSSLSTDGTLTRWSGIPEALSAAFPFFEKDKLQSDEETHRRFDPKSVTSYIDTWDGAKDGSLCVILNQAVVDLFQFEEGRDNEVWHNFIQAERDRRQQLPERYQRHDRDIVTADRFGHFILARLERTGVGDAVKVSGWALVPDVVPCTKEQRESRHTFPVDRNDMAIYEAPTGATYLLTSLQDVYRLETWSDGTFDAFPRAWPGMDGPEFWRFGFGDWLENERRVRYQVNLRESAILGKDALVLKGDSGRSRLTIVSWGEESSEATVPMEDRTRYEVQYPPGGMVDILAVGRDPDDEHAPYWLFGYTFKYQEPHPFPNPRPDQWTILPHLQWCVARFDPRDLSTIVIPVKAMHDGALQAAQAMSMGWIELDVICTAKTCHNETKLSFYERRYDRLFDIVESEQATGE